jgi:hypothetical protein
MRLDSKARTSSSLRFNTLRMVVKRFCSVPGGIGHVVSLGGTGLFLKEKANATADRITTAEPMMNTYAPNSRLLDPPHGGLFGIGVHTRLGRLSSHQP